VCGSKHNGSKWRPNLTFFFKTFISFLILEDKVEHAIGELDDEATLAWRT